MENITYDDLLDRPLPEVDRKSMEFTAHSSDIVAEIVQDGIAENHFSDAEKQYPADSLRGLSAQVHFQIDGRKRGL